MDQEYNWSTASDGYGLSSYRDHYDRERFRPNRPSYEDAYYRAQETLSSTSMLPYYSQRHRGYRSDSGGYAPETESTDDYLMQAHNRSRKRESHSRRPLTSTQQQIAQLEQERLTRLLP